MRAGNRVAARQLRKLALEILVNKRIQAASARIKVLLCCRDSASKWSTIVELTTGVLALLNSLLQKAGIPAHEEVGMESKASVVTGGPEEWLVSRPRVVECLEDPFGLENDQVMGVCLWATACLERDRRISHVRLVVRAVEVDTIPAHGEEDLVTDTVLALVRVREVDVLALSVGGVVRDSTAEV